jgi:hypothetical protein
MKKETAVEWLFEQLCSSKFSWVNYHDKIYFDKTTSDILNQAKEMEKEQIKDAYKSDLYPCSDEDAEEYYQQTFNK